MNNLKLTTKKGNEVELRLTEPYKKEVVSKYVNADGDICLVGEEIREHGQVSVFVNGKPICSSNWYEWAPYYNEHVGAWILFGKAAVDEQTKDAVVEWLNKIREDGTTPEAVAFLNKEKEKEVKKRLAEAHRIVAKAEAQRDIPDKEEARRRMRIYNEINNEGGYGYVPYIYSREEYDEAKEIIRRYNSDTCNN